MRLNILCQEQILGFAGIRFCCCLSFLLTDHYAFDLTHSCQVPGLAQRLVSYSQNPKRSLTGVGLNWSRPMADTFGEGLSDQWTFEAWQMWQLTKRIQVIPSVQILQDPALNPDEYNIVVFGLRGRWVF